MSDKTFGFPGHGSRGALADPERLAARAARAGVLRAALAACRTDIRRREAAVRAAAAAFSTAAGEFYAGTVDAMAVSVAKQRLVAEQDGLELAEAALRYLAPRAL